MPEDTPRATIERLRAAGCVFAEEEAELLMAESESPSELEQMVEQRVSGLPLEYILGWAEFYGRRVIVESGVFVPRRRSELLVREAINLTGRGAVVVDLCCGSGALGLGVAAQVGSIRLYAADIEPVAVHCARRNVEPVGGEVFEGDLFAALPANLRGKIDILIANTPYVPTESIVFLPSEARNFEPRRALDGGADGLDTQRRVAVDALDWLAPAGHLLVETSEHQAQLASAIFESSGLISRISRDNDLEATIIIGTKP